MNIKPLLLLALLLIIVIVSGNNACRNKYGGDSKLNNLLKLSTVCTAPYDKP